MGYGQLLVHLVPTSNEGLYRWPIVQIGFVWFIT